VKCSVSAPSAPAPRRCRGHERDRRRRHRGEDGVADGRHEQRPRCEHEERSEDASGVLAGDDPDRDEDSNGRRRADADDDGGLPARTAQPDGVEHPEQTHHPRGMTLDVHRVLAQPIDVRA